MIVDTGHCPGVPVHGAGDNGQMPGCYDQVRCVFCASDVLLLLIPGDRSLVFVHLPFTNLLPCKHGRKPLLGSQCVV
jgi:hypothetical protein